MRCITDDGEILEQSRDPNRAPFVADISPVATIYIAYLCTKFDNFRRSSDMIGAPKFFNVLHDLTTSLSGTGFLP